jgi:CBS-domain-containing membrane protein
MPGESDQNNRASVPLLASAWNIIGGMIGASLLGYAIGNKMGDKITGALVGMFIGSMYCSYEVWKLIRRLNSK